MHFFNVFVQFCYTLQNEPPETKTRQRLCSIPTRAAASSGGSFLSRPRAWGRARVTLLLGQRACIRLGQSWQDKWVYLGFCILGKWGGKTPTSLHKCCGHTFGKDCIYLMVSAILTYSSRIHKITPLRSQWKNTWEVPNSQWCTRCNQGNREKRIKSFCGRREKKSGCKISLYTSRERQRALSTRNSSGTLPAGISDAFLVQDRAVPMLHAKVPFQVLWMPMMSYPTVQIPSPDTTEQSSKAHYSVELAWTSLASHISFSHPLYSSATSIAVIHVHGFAISDRQASTGWNKRLMLFRHPSQGSDKGQQVFDVPSCSIWEAACCRSHSDAEEMRGRGDHLQRSRCQRSQMQLLEPI